MKYPKQQSKASYAAALVVWRHDWNAEPDRKPSFEPFGLTAEEASTIELDGYDTSCLPDHLRPNLKPKGGAA